MVFVHSSGRDHLDRRNRHLAEVLHRHRLSTLMFDLLTPAEATDRHKVFDRLEVVPGATHLFKEPGALDTAAHLAGHWFANHFSTAWRS